MVTLLVFHAPMAGLQVILLIKRSLISVIKPVSHMEIEPYVISAEDELEHQASTAVCNCDMFAGRNIYTVGVSVGAVCNSALDFGLKAV